MNRIIENLIQNEKFKDYIKDLKSNVTPISILGLVDVAKSPFVYATQEEINKPICIVTYNEIQAKNILKNLKYFYEDVEYFPKKEIVTYDYDVESKELLYERMEVLNKMYSRKTKIVITTIEACMQ